MAVGQAGLNTLCARASANLATSSCYFWQEVLIICTSVIFIWPCSALLFFM
jgi:hypothetical protein